MFVAQKLLEPIRGSLWLCNLSASDLIHSAIPTSARFLLEIFYTQIWRKIWCWQAASLCVVTWYVLMKLIMGFPGTCICTSLHKKISKKKSSPCRDGSMHECTGWQSTKTRRAMHVHNNMHSITWPHYSTTIPT